MLHEFLSQEQGSILDLCRKKIAAGGGTKTTSQLLEKGLPMFYAELIEILTRTAMSTLGAAPTADEAEKTGAAVHGKESLKLGYTLSQVVHSYGAVCQSITEQAELKHSIISTKEFHDLNRCLDVAIAEAVTEFDKAHIEVVSRAEVQRLAYFVHELGNSLSTASIAHTMIQEGHVGSRGSTSKILSQALARMRNLIDRSMTEVRLEGKTVLEPLEMNVISIISEIEATAAVTASLREIFLDVTVDPDLRVIVDRQLLISAVSNLVQNAIKFTKCKGMVKLRARGLDDRVLIEVEDQCGGLPNGKIEELFEPFVQKGNDRSGMGIGLSVSRRAVVLNQGELTARNISGKGCIFTIDLPRTALVAAVKEI